MRGWWTLEDGAFHSGALPKVLRASRHGKAERKGQIPRDSRNRGSKTEVRPPPSTERPGPSVRRRRIRSVSPGQHPRKLRPAEPSAADRAQPVLSPTRASTAHGIPPLQGGANCEIRYPGRCPGWRIPAPGRVNLARAPGTKPSGRLTRWVRVSVDGRLGKLVACSVGTSSAFGAAGPLSGAFQVSGRPRKRDRFRAFSATEKPWEKAFPGFSDLGPQNGNALPENQMLRPAASGGHTFFRGRGGTLHQVHNTRSPNPV